MPIQPENRGRYPADWPAISARIRYERAGNKCEKCGVENHALGGRDPYGRFLTAWPTGDDGLRLTWPKPGDLAWCGPQEAPRRLRIIRIVLTVAHLDNTPENCADENLRAWCQRCHLNYDRHIHVLNRRLNAFRRRAVADLFAGLVPA